MVIRDLPLKELWARQERWRKIYARRLFAATRHWTRGADRHIFHVKYVEKFLTGAKAEAAYLAASDGERVYLIDDDGRRGELHSSKPRLSDFVAKRGAIIFPDTLEWSAAVGPDYFDQVYFAYADWVGEE